MMWQVTLKFLNEEAKIIHGNIRLGSVFMGESGEWKLGGFEVLSAVADDEPFIYVSLRWTRRGTGGVADGREQRYGSLLPDAGRFAAPEIGKGGWEGLKKYVRWREILGKLR